MYMYMYVHVVTLRQGQTDRRIYEGKPPAVLLQQWQASEDAAGAGASGGAGANGFALHCDGAIAASRLAKLRSFGNNESYAG